ncbi:MAG TPA: alpha/beta fold hydrolase [Solirubrobacteraceae bacterium]|nr:alpha/beta fold hydrolase [Solirubrobacteraceae bacterium]
MHGSLLGRSAAALVVLATVLPASAHAVGLGAPGKVAVTNPGAPVRIWDPVQAVEEAGQPDAGFTTIAAKGAPDIGDRTFSFPSRPQWSPDGTKLVFAQSAEDPGDQDDFGPMEQTSIYLYTVATGDVQRLTTPEPRLIDEDDDDLSEGHIVTDYAPTFTADGTQVAFLRNVDAAEDDELHPHEGVQLWTVPVAGGSPTRRSSFDPDTEPSFMGLVSIPGTSSFLASGVDDDYAVWRLELGSSSWQEIPGTRGVEAVPPTLDVSPDGTRFSRTELMGESFGAAVRKLDGSLIARHEGTDASAFSPTGNGAIGHGCVRDRCGLVETLGFADDRPRDTGGDEQRLALTFPHDDHNALLAVQPQQLPIVFLPGFLGSEIACGGEMQWPAVPQADALGMRLAADGVANAGCPGTAPTGKALGSFLSKDVYESISVALKNRFGARAVVLGWDWRKRAEESWDELDAVIAELTSSELAQEQGVGRVVLWGHSYGGLLARSYLTEHPEKVAQILSVGSPFLGSPKVVFPLAFGIETPMFSTMDLLWDNDDLKAMSKNLAGLYELMPSAEYPRSWFSIDGEAKSTVDMVARLNGNTSLLAQAQDDHAELFDGFDDRDGRVDVRALVGTGMSTIDRIDLRPYDGEEDDITVHLGNGDGTVPGISANQGELGTEDPLGDDVRVQYQCDVDHVALANDPQVIEAYLDWADHGAVPLEIERRPCEVDGLIYEFTPGEIDDDPAATRRAGAAATTLAAAEGDGLVDVVRLPRRTLVIADRRRASPFTVELRGATFRVTPAGPDGEGATAEYGPVDGSATITPASSPGGLPTVTVGGVVVTPRAVTDGPSEPTDPGDGGDGGDGGDDLSGELPIGDRGPVPPSVDDPRATPPTPGPVRQTLRLVGRPRLRGKVLTLRVAVPGKGVLRTRATARGRTLAQRKSTAASARTVSVSLRLRSRPRSPMRVAMTFVSAGGGAAVRLNATVRP